MIKASATSEPPPGHARLTIEHHDRPDEHFFIPTADMTAWFHDFRAKAAANAGRYADEDVAAQA
jgi:hypothetical protein